MASAGGAVLPNLSMAVAGAQGFDTAQAGVGPYGPLAQKPDENGLLLPDGFTSRIVGVAGDNVGSTDYAWPLFPDGAACFPADGGGWIYVCNSEVPDQVAPASGGVSAVRFDADGNIVDAYRILGGSSTNCAGGPTPWGNWLSGEEFAEGQIWECDPTGINDAVARPAMGRFTHEAAAVDPQGETVYLTEDNREGLLYRFTPSAYPDLSDGDLEAMVVGDDGTVSWTKVPDPSGDSAPTRNQPLEATRFNGGEGIWYHDDTIYFTTKGDHSVHRLDLTDSKHTVIWAGDPEGLGVEGAVLSHVDNITVDAGSGDLFVAEDGGNMEVVMISAEGSVAPFVRVTGHPASEVTGPCFNPARDRLYFSSQRGPTTKKISEIIGGAEIDGVALDFRFGGVTFEVSGPFRGISTNDDVPAPTTTLAGAAPSSDSSARAAREDTDGDDDSVVPYVVGGAALAAAAAGGLVALRRRNTDGARPGTDGQGQSSPAGSSAENTDAG